MKRVSLLCLLLVSSCSATGPTGHKHGFVGEFHGAHVCQPADNILIYQKLQDIERRVIQLQNTQRALNVIVP